MGAVVDSPGWARRVPLWVVDVVVAVLLSTAAVGQVGSLRYHAPVWVAVGSCLACTTTVAWRRWEPAAAALVSVSGMLIYQLATGDPNLAFEPLAWVLVFYLLGRRARRRMERLVVAGLVACALGVCTTIAANSNGASAVSGVGAWAL
ncbi:MAG: hypothetical protein ACR2MN_01645 [Acidimicrobiales bacterium]